MKVKELIERLEKFPEDLDILCYTEEAGLLAPKHGLRLLDILEVSATDAERKRADDQVPALKLGKSDVSEKLVMIEVIADF